MVILLMDKILHYPLEGIYHNSHSLRSLRSCRILSINSTADDINPASVEGSENMAIMVNSLLWAI